jgi:chemotaxis protein methyltransferase CheR
MDYSSAWLEQAFIRLITDRTGLAIKEHDRASLREKIGLRMKALKLLLPDAYYQLLTSKTVENVQEWQNLIDLIANPESFFFRDQGQISLLQDQILPELIERNQLNKTLRICSAGCSTGEEAYSLAILLKQLIPDLNQWNLLILGLDMNSTALEKARVGIYRPWSLRTLHETVRQHHFRFTKGHYYLNEQIRQMVKFQMLNLASDLFPQVNSDLEKMDLILCRNVFIYFEETTIAMILEKFYHTLAPSGYLLTGHSELHGQDVSQFEIKIFLDSIAYQRPDPQHIESPSLSPSFTHSLKKQSSRKASQPDLETAFETNMVKMQHVALNLLKQLPADTKIPKLNNLTASELILQVESTLNLSNPSNS